MTHVVKAARNARRSAQAMAVFALCLGAGMVLPLALLSVGFHSF